MLTSYNEIFTRRQHQDMPLSIEDTQPSVNVDMLSAEESQEKQIMSFPDRNLTDEMID